MPYYNHLSKQSLSSVLERIKKSIYTPVSELEVTTWTTPEPVSFEKRFSGEKSQIALGQSWGKLWDCAWFHFTGSIPEAAANKNLVLLIDISGEACIVDSSGTPVQGLTTVSSEFDLSLGRPGKRVVKFLNNAEGGEIIDLWADAGCNDLFGKYQDSGTLKEAHIAECNEEMHQLYYDFEVLYELLEQLSEDKARYHSIFYALREACNVLRKYNVEEAQRAREILAPELHKKCGDSSLGISAIGHAHIDLAWLWPIRETIRKGARTFSTVLANMEQYPDYIFGASQAQLYQWIKDYYPTLYKKIKQRITEGRWEVQGAMWVEPDTNVSGGEALVRQILYGKRFFRNEFNKDMKTLWLPDVFGYSAALPQILKKAGVDYFMTIKLSWSKVNKHPHHTFIWEGIDGSKILAHMPPEGEYNSSAAPRAIAKIEKNFLDKGISDNCLLLFGIGDGGGGPGEEHLERLKREKDLNGLVPVIQEPSLDFFKKIEHNISRYKTWRGELYLEFHQGTYTTQARSKRHNRKLEISLRELEFAAVQAMVISNKKYPQEELESIWKEMLLYQFHDILPGSSISRVYDESLERYKLLLERTNKLIYESYSASVEGIIPSEAESASHIFNSLSWEREDWININGHWEKIKIPAMGHVSITMHEAHYNAAVPVSQDNVLENNIYKIVFNNNGFIESIFDKELNRDVLAENAIANTLCIFEDTGNAWDFPIEYDEKPFEPLQLVEYSYQNEGPRLIRKNTYRYGPSSLIQEVILAEGSRRIDFVTIVDWKETNKMLRTSFPVNVYATEATCEIQFGNIKRPTHRNTSWDMAKYEICAHKWVDISQGDFGVALLNDCKYGHKVIGNIIDLNLLRSTCYPDPDADRAVHEFTYSLFPHEGDYIKGGVVRAGYEVNVPLYVLPGHLQVSDTVISKSFISVDAENIVIETIKKAEDNEDIIVRLYECSGMSATAKLRLGFNYKCIQMVDIMEENINTTDLDQEKLQLSFKPFELHTLRISR